MKNEIRISIARIYFPVKVLGPGNRVGIWLNGCNRKCVGCISPELRTYDTTKEVSLDEIMRMIETIDSQIDGFTISGGEPFYKPNVLNALVESLLTISDDILIFSGFTLEELNKQKNTDVDSVLKNCAALVDGPYIRQLSIANGLRGSSNQRFWIFKHQEKYANIENIERNLQNILYNNKILTIGIP